VQRQCRRVPASCKHFKRALLPLWRQRRHAHANINGSRARGSDIIVIGNAVNPKANLSAICNALAAAINIAPLVAQDYNVSRNGRRCAFGYSEHPVRCSLSAARKRVDPLLQVIKNYVKYDKISRDKKSQGLHRLQSRGHRPH